MSKAPGRRRPPVRREFERQDDFPGLGEAFVNSIDEGEVLRLPNQVRDSPDTFDRIIPLVCEGRVRIRSKDAIVG